MIISLDDIKAARDRIANVIRTTHLNESRNCSEWVGTQVFLKFENQQRTGSFKIRGALNKIIQATDEQKQNGFVAASAGNHAQGVAFAATHVGAKSYIVMPESTPLVKSAATQGYGAEIILRGQSYDDCYDYARQLEKEKGYCFVHAFEDPLVMAGQGTIGLEVLEKIPDLDSIVVAIGGGGLISGIGTAVKAINPKIKVFGAVAKNAAGMDYLFHKKKYDPATFHSTIADGIAVKAPSQLMYDNYISKVVDDIYAVGEADIAQAMVTLLERSKTIVEGSGAIGLAAAARAGWDLGKKTCVVLCGGNIDMNLIAQVIEKGLSKSGRLSRFTVVVDDRPGALHELTGLLADQRANVLEVQHDRLSPHLDPKEAAIEFVIETRDQEHFEKIKKALAAAGARIEQ